MFLLSVCCFAQDVIVKKNGSTVVCRVVNVNSSEVVYKKWSDLKGANYVMNASDVSTINYSDGRTETLSISAKNEYAPGLQNSGQAQVRDNALLMMDGEMSGYQAKYKRLKRTAWIGGGILVGLGIIGTYVLSTQSNAEEDVVAYVGGGLFATGIVWTGCFLYSASRYKKANLMTQTCPIWQKEFKFNNESSFALGVDAIYDNVCKDRTFGVGLRYNF